MKAACIEQTGKPSVIRVVTQRKPKIPSGCLLIKNQYSSVNPRDCLIRAGKYQLQPLLARPPLVLGSDFAGTVIGIGKEVQGFSFGDRVFGIKNPSQGLGANASYVVVKAVHTAHLPDELPFCQGAALPLVTLTAWQALCGNAERHHLKGKQILLFGASGGVGVHALQLAVASGAEVHTVTSPENTGQMIALGAEKAYDYHSKNYAFADQRFDIIFDAVGKYPYDDVKPLIKKDGRYVTTVPTLRFVFESTFSHLVRLLGVQRPIRSFVAVKPNSTALQSIAQLVKTKKLTAIIDSVYPLEELDKAHLKVQTQKVTGKVVIKINDVESNNA